MTGAARATPRSRDGPAQALRITPARDVPAQPWKNGGGATRELLAWPASGGWQLRVSLADIDRDGPFSAFPGVTRWFSVIEGAGVVLAFADTEHRVRAGDAPLRFGGALAPGCRLIDGPTRDINLMTRSGHATMLRMADGTSWDDELSMRGLFTAVGGRWSCGDTSRRLEARTLLWAEDGALHPGPWRFESDATGVLRAPGDGAVSGWWLGFTPDEARP